GTAWDRTGRHQAWPSPETFAGHRRRSGPGGQPARRWSAGPRHRIGTGAASDLRAAALLDPRRAGIVALDQCRTGSGRPRWRGDPGGGRAAAAPRLADSVAGGAAVRSVLARFLALRDP